MFNLQTGGECGLCWLRLVRPIEEAYPIVDFINIINRLVRTLGQLGLRTNPLIEAVRYGCNVKGINQSVHFTSGGLWVI